MRPSGCSLGARSGVATAHSDNRALSSGLGWLAGCAGGWVGRGEGQGVTWAMGVRRGRMVGGAQLTVSGWAPAPTPARP